ncbi:hypothetical protein [Jatrophihabitans sp.]|uniref:hypothetical protein n=1 Tax=Jatrophihabitans sp. TaxID=1932789 RepID=UPI0030C755B0
MLLWRGARSVQLEVGLHRLLVDGVDSPAVQELLTPSPATGGVGRLRTALTERGYLWPASDPLTPPEPRLAAELTALAARVGPDAVDVLAERGTRCVVVQGTGRAGPAIAALLAAAGVGHVHMLERAPARLVHVLPGGAGYADEGASLSDATAAAVLRVAPGTDVTPPALGRVPDLVVLAIDDPVDSDRRAALHAREVAHLRVRLAPGVGVVGPLVVPGLTSCLGCADLHRRDRDPAWPALALQLGTPRRYTTTAEVTTSALIAAVATTQALAFLDGEEAAAVDGTLEVHPPDWRIRRRSWASHADCGCLSVQQGTMSP